MMTEFRVLSSLPPYGPLPEQFSKGGRGTHREGFVVEFYPDTPQAWVGNFQPGLGRYSGVLHHPNGSSVIVVAGGVAYVIDPVDRRLASTFGGAIDGILNVPPMGILITNNITCLEAWDRNGLRWRTRRISWDGLSDLRITDSKITGQAWGPLGDLDSPFTVDLATGAAEGGTYDAPSE